MKRLLLVFIFAANALAIPQLVNYQGQLTSPSGTPLDTTVAMTFRIWPTPAGGSPDWTEAHAEVVVTSGLFQVLLGSVTALPDSFAVNRWLGITIASDPEMTPREELVSVPYAFRAGTVDGASGGTIIGDVNVTGKANIGGANINSGLFAFVAGRFDTASGGLSVVSGGYSNVASSDYATVGGGNVNRASASSSTISGGANNTASGQNAAIGGGSNNDAIGISATVSGGQDNTASNDYATVSGGRGNAASGVSAIVCGGEFNDASDFYATIGGGINNSASSQEATVGGGQSNDASGSSSTICGGFNNSASALRSSVGGGSNNIAGANYSTVSGGIYNKARGQYAVVAGGGSGAEADSNSATGSSTFIGGGRRNLASGVVATIGGGEGNISSSSRSTVGGGFANIASSTQSTVSGGEENAASGSHGFVGGGGFNYARGAFATIAGGGGDAVTDSNSARGIGSVIPGGSRNETSGSFTLAAGHRAKAFHSGAFVWADSTASDFASTALDQFNVRASGGVRIYTNSTLTSGVTMAAGAGAWVVVSDSAKKQNRRLVDTKEILQKITQLPIEQWSYKSQDTSIEHIGPMAQNFWTQFHLGEDSLGISTIDPDGVALAAIQELAKQNEQKDKKIAELEARMKMMEAAMLQFGVLNISDKQ